LKLAYIDHGFYGKALATIEMANGIIDDYAAQGFTLTLRQLYYQFVSRGLLPNTERHYKQLGEVVNKGRLAGLIDWDAIEDRTRNLHRLPSWESPGVLLTSAAEQFRLDKWADQPYRPEVWIEKDALVGVIESVCTELQVPYFACRGYCSQSEMWAAAQRLGAYEGGAVVLYLGDHDPSGIDMSRDIEDRLEMFEAFARVERLALNIGQVRDYNPPPNPAKMTDTRASDYVQQFGRESWELDALEPAVIAGLIRDAVLDLRDDELWTERIREEESARERLRAYAAEITTGKPS